MKFSKENSLEENFKIAFEEAKDHWLITQFNDERKKFEVAVLSVSTFYGIESPEFERIKNEMKLVNALHFTPSNVKIDLVGMMEELPKNFKPIGLVKLWKEVNPTK